MNRHQLLSLQPGQKVYYKGGIFQYVTYTLSENHCCIDSVIVSRTTLTGEIHVVNWQDLEVCDV